MMPVTPNPPPDEEPLTRLGDLVRSALRSQASLAKQSLELSRAALTGELDRSSAGKAYLEAVSREGARYWRAASELGVDYVSDLLALNSRITTRILNETAGSGRGNRSATRPAEDAAAAPPAPAARRVARRVAVTLRGPLGGQASGSVTVTNRHPRARRVELVASDLRDASGAPVGASLEITPRRVTLPAGEDQAVRLAVDLDPSDFTEGGRYTGSVEVSGGDEATVDVTLEVGG